MTARDWSVLRARAAAVCAGLSAPAPGAPGLCLTCKGRAGSRYGRCYPCQLHRECAEDGLANVVVPIAYAVKGGPHARRLWHYKHDNGRGPVLPGAAGARLAVTAGQVTAAGQELSALLAVFLADHGDCVWRAARMESPTHVSVVPSSAGRQGEHPLRSMAAACLDLPRAELSARGDGYPDRDLDPRRFSAAGLRGARVLLLDDTWTTGASAQSASLALRLAGAASVAVVVLGRHIGAGRAGGPGWRADLGPEAMPFRPESCAVHAAG